MPMIYAGQGEQIADIALSEKQQALLAAGSEITVIYHTPQLLRSLLGARNGAFTLRKDGERIVANELEAFKDYVGLQKAIATARGT